MIIISFYSGSVLNNTNFEIIYQDKHFVAINKPHGYFVHRSDLDRRAPYVLKTLSNQIGKKLYPVHRLDRPTSGVLLFALDSGSAGFLCNEFRENRIDKTYLAIVRGYTKEGETIDYPLTPEKGKNSQDAKTSYSRLATVEIDVPVGRYNSARYSLIKVKPETGRRHQIRKHLAHIFHPIAGDTVHGDGKHNRFFREHFDIHRLLLVASEITFFHPYEKKSVKIHAEFDREIKNLFVRLGWEKFIK